MKHVTNEILRSVIDSIGVSDYKIADKIGVSRSNVFKYKNEQHNMNPSAETWLKSLVRLGHVKVKDGQLVIKSDAITKDLIKGLAS